MANPQKENGHIDIANEIVDYLCQYRISGQQMQILWVILRKTWGWAVIDKYGNYIRARNGEIKKKKKDRISLSQFSRLTGIPSHKCHELLKSLIDKNIVIKDTPNKGSSRGVTYRFNKNYEEWKILPKKGVLPIMGVKVLPIMGDTKEKERKVKKTPMAIKKEYLDLVDLLSEKIRANDSGAKVPDTEKRRSAWANDFRLLVETDGRPLDEVQEILVWSQEDIFWRGNILSPGALRKKYTRLKLKIEGERKHIKPDPAELTRKEMKA